MESQPTPRQPILTGKRSVYAIAAASIADIVVSLVQPEYVGFFKALALLLTGG